MVAQHARVVLASAVALIVVAIPVGVAAGASLATPQQRAVAIAYASFGKNWAKEWTFTHPRWKSVITQSKWVKCQQQGFKGLSYKINNVQVEGTSGLTATLPRLGKVNVTDVTLAVFVTPKGKTSQTHISPDVYLVNYHGQWVRVFAASDYNAYKSGRCPA